MTSASESEIVAAVGAWLVENYLWDRDGFTLGEHDSMTEHKVLDSLGVLNLITFLEQKFSISVGETDVHPDNLDSLRKIAAFVLRKRG